MLTIGIGGCRRRHESLVQSEQAEERAGLKLRADLRKAEEPERDEISQDDQYNAQSQQQCAGAQGRDHAVFLRPTIKMKLNAMQITMPLKNS
jgi:hypothetical protein